MAFGPAVDIGQPRGPGAHPSRICSIRARAPLACSVPRCLFILRTAR